MKTTLNFKFAVATTVSALFVACDNQFLPSNEPNPSAIPVYINTTPGKETILLAKKGMSITEEFEMSAYFRSKYGYDNVAVSGGLPMGEFGSIECDESLLDPDVILNCIEVTVSIEFPEHAVPSVKDFRGTGFSVIRIYGRVATCKRYDWAFTDEGTDAAIYLCVQSYNQMRDKYLKGAFYDGDFKVYGGTIIGVPSVRNLGPEVINEPVIF